MDLDPSGGRRGRRFFRRRDEAEDGETGSPQPDAASDQGAGAGDDVTGVAGALPGDPADPAPPDAVESGAGPASAGEDDRRAPQDGAAAEEAAVASEQPAETGADVDAADEPEAVVHEAPVEDPEEVTTVDTPEQRDGPLGPLPPLELPRVLAVANQKGGVGKTTTAVNLGAALADLGFRVLVVDLDPQGNATTGLGINHRNVEGSIYDVIMNDAAIDDCVEPTSLRNLFVVPATIDLAGAEIELVPAFSRELKLKRALDEVRDGYDIMLIDCPPSLGLLTVNGLAAADDVIVPIQCEYYALEGLGQLLRNVDLVSRNLNPRLSVRGIVLTMYDARTKLAGQVEGEVRSHFGDRVYRTVVPRTVRISEAPSFGQPVTLFDPSSRGAIAYRELAKEVSRGASRRTG